MRRAVAAPCGVGRSGADDRPTTILLWDGLTRSGEPERIYGDSTRLLLRHEVWHALTHRSDHLADPSCAASGLFEDREAPCVEEAAIVADAAPILLYFPEDRGAAEDAARWWNQATGRPLVGTR
jgi:hypothetical protein